MTSTADLIQHSSLLWLMATGLVLGALHALEPGHSKTMIASFIVATRGTVPQAVLLGVSAAFSHSALIWVLAAAALYFGNNFIGDDAEPWLQLGSGLIIVGIGVTMAWRHVKLTTARHLPGPIGPQGGMLVDAGSAFAEIAIFEDGVPPQFQLFFYDREMRPADAPAGDVVTIKTVRPGGAEQKFAFNPAGLCLTSTTEIPEPHEFTAVLSLSHAGHAHTYQVPFTEHDHSHHHHAHEHHANDAHHHDHHEHSHTHFAAGDEDAHARAHARQIAQRLKNGPVTTKQIALFGLSSGLMPCPAALTMLLVCLRLKKVALGVGLVTAFSAGLAFTMVSLGVIASIGVRHAAKHLPGFGWVVDYLPYASSALIVGVGIFMGLSGYAHIA